MKHLLNPALPVILPGWQGNPYEDGQFQNLGPRFDPPMSKVLRWMLTPNPQRKEKNNDKWVPEVRAFDPEQAGDRDFIVWLGHASFYLRLGGVNMLLDPVFYNVSMVKRLICLAIEPEHLHHLDYVLVSHDHRDHCDEDTLKALGRSNNNFELLTGLKMEKLLKGWLPNLPLQEAGWYQKYRLKEPELEIFYLPAYHWGRRGLFDTKKRLWGSYIIRYKDKTIYFGADSGYESHFRQIGELFPDIDLALLGIGAYKPPYLMGRIHTSPDQAIQCFRELGARRMMAMHYGTYSLSNEPMGEPYRRMLYYKQQSEFKDRILLPAVGEVVREL